MRGWMTQCNMTWIDCFRVATQRVRTLIWPAADSLTIESTVGDGMMLRWLADNLSNKRCLVYFTLLVYIICKTNVELPFYHWMTSY